MKDTHEKLWQQGLEALNCQANEDQIKQLKHYVSLLDRWNKTYNLTAIRDTKDMIPLHIFDSLVVADYIKGDNCLDVGSGAGLPTIPLAIMQPERQFTSLDTNGKKTRFVQQAIIELGLKKSVYDFVTASSQHLSEDGILYAMKGQYPEGEMQYLPKEYKVITSHELKVPFVDGERHIIEINVEKS